ncbi:MAG: ferredoxin thioredoxin reductase catalytic beta chain [Clostridia bacterium]|nr:ferredoxin thioredoxin reductase catalytic beta chain [Clostridia bacterium]
MRIRLNEDKEIVKIIKEGLLAKDGYCPCRVGKKPEYKCMCAEFRGQIADPNFEGLCHCKLFYKEK